MKTIKVKEDVGVKNFRKFYEDVRDIFDSDSDPVMDFTNVKNIDPFAAQVLIAAIKSAKNKNKLITFMGLTREVRSQLATAGLSI